MLVCAVAPGAAALSGAANGRARTSAPQARALTGGAQATVAIHTFGFRPDTLVIRAGTRVTWRNDDAILHTATSGTPEHPDSAFDGVMEDAGRTFSHTFERAGTFSYYCSRHPFMRGVIHVTSTGDVP